MNSSSVKPLLRSVEEATLPVAPKINAIHRAWSNYCNSAHAARIKNRVFAQALEAQASTCRLAVWAETRLRCQEIFINYAQSVKQLTPAVVRGAVEVNAAIEAARPLGYAVLDHAQHEAQQIIQQNVTAGLVSREDADRRVAKTQAARAKDEERFDRLIETAKEGNDQMALAAVSKVKEYFEDTPLPANESIS